MVVPAATVREQAAPTGGALVCWQDRFAGPLACGGLGCGRRRAEVEGGGGMQKKQTLYPVSVER